MDTASLSAYVSRFTQGGAKFPGAHGDERRDIVDVRFAGTRGSLDWDVEAMNQVGRIGLQDVEAWAFGSLAGYTLTGLPWKPRLGIQVDAASGDRSPTDNRLNTFNPLFPNGYYVTLAGYTGYVNFIHVKPSVTVHPLANLKLMGAVGFQWRETTADAVYTQPTIPVAGTVGRPGRYTGLMVRFVRIMPSIHMSWRSRWCILRLPMLFARPADMTATTSVRNSNMDGRTI